MSSVVLDYAISVIDGDRPSARGGHTATMAENQIVIFGGSCYTTGGNFAYYNDTYVLDTENRLYERRALDGVEELLAAAAPPRAPPPPDAEVAPPGETAATGDEPEPDRR